MNFEEQQLTGRALYYWNLQNKIARLDEARHSRTIYGCPKHLRDDRREELGKLTRIISRMSQELEAMKYGALRVSAHQSQGREVPSRAIPETA